MPSNNPEQDEIELIIRQKDAEIAAAQAKIQAQAQLIADQETVIAAQKAMIANLIERVTYHERAIKEIEAQIGLQSKRADKLEERAEELEQQVEWIRRRIFVIDDGRGSNDAIC